MQEHPLRRRISATTLAQYVRFGNCDRLLYFTLHPERAEALQERWRISEQPLTPLLRASGEGFEHDVVSRVQAAGETVVDLAHQREGATLAQLRAAAGGQRLVLAQASLAGSIGDWPCGGNADLIWLIPGSGTADRARQTVSAIVADVKSSLHERVEHRLQVAFYVRLLRQMAEREGIVLTDVQGAVLHREEGDALPEIRADALDTFDLTPYDLALDHLLAEDGVVARIAAQSFEGTGFSLSFKCDGCLFNAHCMHDSAASEHVALVPHLSAAEQRVLEQHGVRSYRQLAQLTHAAAPRQYRGPLEPAPGQEQLLQTLRGYWQLAGLDRHTQRARALVRARDRALADRDDSPHGGFGNGAAPGPPVFEPAIDSGFGTLPADEAHRGIVKVFFDAQHDYVRDGVYLLVALVKGPNGEEVVLERTAAPVDRESEGESLARWVPRVYGAVLAAAGAAEAFVHLYTYSRHDQSVLLAALRRHLGRVPAIAALFDLLTESPGREAVSPLAQPMISFLAEELRDRRTLDVTCTSLHAVAGRLGFRWTGPTPAGVEIDFSDRFRARVFDGRRLVELPVADGAARQVFIESAARFRSQIPLEYAYGAWGALPEPADALQERLLQPYQDITWDELDGFAAHRMRGLALIEERITPKNRFLGKTPLPLAQLALAALTRVDLPRALQDFLLVEHHARLQDLLLSYGQPVERRVQTGRGMLVECLSYRDLGGGSAAAECRVVFDQIGIDPVLAEQALRLKERDWVVVNPVATTQPMQMVHGRLATVERLENDPARGLIAHLELKWLTFNNRVFAFWHRGRDALRPGQFYTVDEMADDLNGDKLLAACRVASDGRYRPNPLLESIAEAERAIAAADDAIDPPVIGVPALGAEEAASRERAATAFLRTIAAIEEAEGREAPTPRQQEVIAEHLGESCLLVQGPPGSGKSHTLGWAILVRIAAARRAGAPSLRVAVSSKTHNAIGIVLASAASKLALLRRYAPYSPLAQALSDLSIYKVGGDEDALGAANGAAGVHHLDYYAARDQLDAILSTPWLVIGATPGGLYSLQRYRGIGGRDVSWDERPFDLLVIDEASQVSLPEAVLASAFLQPHGQALVVGDHRQMPPIVAVEWNEEARRSVVDNEAYRSVFEFLRDRRFPRVGLDRSFRLHRRLAAFLEEIVYRQDGIPFFSTGEALLPPIGSGDPFVDAVLDPGYPVVVVEHSDASSHQFNQAELDLLTPLLDACTSRLGLDTQTGVGVVVPHRAQRAMLRARFPNLAAGNAIDTVERFQGGERDVIFVSATASDPDYVLSEADFLLNPNRLNVALSRPRRKLVVLASTTLLRLLTSDPDLFEYAALWKRLRYTLASTPLWRGTTAGTEVQVFGCSAVQVAQVSDAAAAEAAEFLPASV